MRDLHFGQKTQRTWAPEFQAVILAGYGTTLQPLTDVLATGSTSSPTPKALLPIANMPMIFYPILWLQGAGVRDILVVCPASHKTPIHDAIHASDSESHPTFNKESITIETLDDSEAASYDTADILRKFASSFITDLIILPCDFIPPPGLRLSSLLNDYRVELERPLLKVLLYERSDIKDDNKIKDGAQLYGIDKATKSLVFVDPSGDDDEELDLNMSLLWRYPNTYLTRKFLDSHVYIVRRAVLDLLAERPSLESFRDDFLPWVCKLPHRKSHRTKYARALRIPSNPQSNALAHSSIPYSKPGAVADLLEDAAHNGPALPGAGSSDLFPTPDPSQASQNGDDDSDDSDNPRRPRPSQSETPKADVDPATLRCGVTLHRLKDGYTGRANTVASYFELNRQALLIAAAAAAGPVPTPLAPAYGPNAQISSDSKVAISVRVGERTSIKKSVIGPHCIIGRNVKISGCVIMDHVEIRDGAKLDNSILSRNTVIGERAQLKDCELAPGVTTQNDASLKGEKLSAWQ